MIKIPMACSDLSRRASRRGHGWTLLCHSPHRSVLCSWNEAGRFGAVPILICWFVTCLTAVGNYSGTCDLLPAWLLLAITLWLVICYLPDCCRLSFWDLTQAPTHRSDCIVSDSLFFREPNEQMVRNPNSSSTSLSNTPLSPVKSSLSGPTGVSSLKPGPLPANLDDLKVYNLIIFPFFS